MSPATTWPRYVRLSPAVIARVIARLREIGRRTKDAPRIIADEFEIPLGMVLEIWKARDVAVEQARAARWRGWGPPQEKPREPIAEPTPPPAVVPMDRQREIVAAYRQGQAVEVIADLYQFHERAVVNVLIDAGYAVALTMQRHRREGLSK